MKAFMFVLAVVLVIGMSTVANAQQPNSEIGMTVDVSAAPLSVDNAQDLSVSGLTVGTAVALVPDGADAFLDGANTPNDVYSNIVSNSVPGAVDVIGSEGASVIISFALPFALYSDGTGPGLVRVDYNGTSACWVVDESGIVTYFNPKNPATLILPPTAGDPVHVNLGGIFTVEPGSNAGIYNGTAIVTAAYAAN